MPLDPNLIPAVRATAARLGINASDLLTAMSYETGGTLNHNLWGGRNNQHLGLIQFGPAEQAKYGVKPGMAVGDQVTAAENFLRDRGVRPGMGLMDIYSTINAGAPGLYNLSDAANGGMPGTVADKVNQQMAGHRARAEALLAQPYQPAPPSAPQLPPAINVNSIPQVSPNLPLFVPGTSASSGVQQSAPPQGGMTGGPSFWQFLAPPTSQPDLTAWWGRQNPTE